jgi:hypothetical protein
MFKKVFKVKYCAAILLVGTSYASQFWSHHRSEYMPGQRAKHQFSVKRINDLPIPYEGVPQNQLVNSSVAQRLITNHYDGTKLKDVTIYSARQARCAAGILGDTAMEAAAVPLDQEIYSNIGRKQRIADTVTSGLRAIVNKLFPASEGEAFRRRIANVQDLYISLVRPAGQKPDEQRWMIIDEACNIYLHEIRQIALKVATLPLTAPISIDEPITVQFIADRCDSSTAAKIVCDKKQTTEDTARDVAEFCRWRMYNGTAHHVEIAGVVADDVENMAAAFDSTSSHNTEIADRLSQMSNDISGLAELYVTQNSGPLDAIGCSVKNCVTTARIKMVMNNALTLAAQLDDVLA